MRKPTIVRGWAWVMMQVSFATGNSGIDCPGFRDPGANDPIVLHAGMLAMVVASMVASHSIVLLPCNAPIEAPKKRRNIKQRVLPSLTSFPKSSCK